MRDEILEVVGLKKYFGDIKAVDDLSFSVKRGSVFAFLGLNGAGKSTAINIICTLLKKDKGRVVVDGFDLDDEADKIRATVGIVFQNSVLDKPLSVRDNLLLRAGYYGLSGVLAARRIEELSRMLDLDGLLDRRYGKLSGGQRRRTDIARALLHTPKLLFLDEPTTGLDPQSRHTVWENVERLCAQTGMTVFLTTHYMEEANRADNIVILDNGKIAAQGSPVDLKDAYSSDYIKIYAQRTEEADAAFAPYGGFYQSNRYLVAVGGSAQAKSFLKKFDTLIEDFEVVKGDMDDVFLKVTGKKLEVTEK